VLNKDTCFFFFGYNYIWGSDTLDGLYLSTDAGKTFSIDTSQPLENIQEPSVYVEHIGDVLLKYVEGLDTIRKSYVKAEYWSRDLGKTWQRTKFPFADSVLFATFYLSDSLRFVQTKDTNSNSISLVYRSSDAGITWTQLSEPVPTTLHAWYINFLSQRGSSLYLNRDIYISPKQKDYYLLRSTDDGLHWKQIRLPDTSIHKLSGVFGTDTSLVFSDDLKYFNGNYRTDTSFQSSITFSAGNIFGGYSILLYVTGKNLYAYPFGAFTASQDSVYVSKDNGISWSIFPYSPHFYLYQCPWVNNGKFAFSLASKNRAKEISVLRSSDEGETWSEIFSVPFGPYENLPSLVADDSVIIVNLDKYHDRDSSVFYSNDDGNTWVSIPPPAVDTLTAFAVRSYGGTLFYNNTYYSDALGKWWGKIKLPTIEVRNSIFGYGRNWFSSCVQRDSQSVNLRHYRSSDKGEHWTDVVGLPPNTDIFYGTNEKGVLYVVATSLSDAQGQFGGCKLYYSIDSGLTWSQAPGNVLRAPNLFSGSDYLFMTGDQELWRLPKSLASVRTSEPQSSGIQIVSAYPNPARDKMNISLLLPKDCVAKVVIYDLTGRLIATLTDERYSSGTYEVEWNTKTIPSGAYIVELSAGGEKASKVVQVVK
jgi:photosystem II stability/assembly factor-like uncharacterized protein